MYFNRKNAEQKNWRMIKKGKHFLFGCSLVFAVGATLATPAVHADSVEAKAETTTSAAQAEPTTEAPTYVAPAATSPVATEPVDATAESKEVSVDKTQLEAVLAQAKAKSLEGQEASVKAEVEAEIAEAEALVANGSASQEQVNKSVERLTQALASVKEVTEVAAETTTEAVSEATAESSETPKVRNKRATTEGTSRAVDESRLDRVTVTKDNFDSFFKEGGNASYDETSGTIKLTDDVGGQVGSAYLRFKIDPKEDFTFTGKVDIGDKYEGHQVNGRDGGDGVGFVFHTGNVDTIGQSGASIGMGTIKNAFGFKLDSWHNTTTPNASNNAPMDPKYGGNAWRSNAFGAFYSSNAAGRVATVGDAKALNPKPNGQWVDFKIEYKGQTKEFIVTYGYEKWSTNLKTANASIMAPTAKTALNNSNATYALSFLGSTGSGTNLQRVQIEKFEFTAPQIVQVAFYDEAGNELAASSAIPGDRDQVVNLNNIEAVQKAISKIKAKGYTLKEVNSDKAETYNSGANTVTLRSGGQLLKYVFAVPSPAVTPTLQATGSMTVAGVKSTDNTFSGTGVPGATVTVKVAGVTLADNITVGTDGTWTTTLSKGLNSNITNQDQLVPKDSVTIIQKIGVSESEATEVAVGLGESVVQPSTDSKDQQSIVAETTTVTLKVPHDAGVAYFDYPKAGNARSEVAIKRDSIPGAWTSKDESKAVVTSYSSDGFFDTIVLEMKEKIQPGKAKVISNIKETKYSSPVGWKEINVEAKPDTTPPVAPTVNPVKAGATAITGTAEAGSTVEVTLPNGQKASAKAGDNGEFSITVPALSVDDQISVTATDAANNTSDATTVTVKENVRPTLHIPYDDPATQAIYVYSGEENNIELKVTDNSGKIVKAYLALPQDNRSGLGVEDTTFLNGRTRGGLYLKTEGIHVETTATESTPAIVRVTGEVPKNTYTESSGQITRYLFAEDAAGNTGYEHVGDATTPGQLGRIRFMWKPQTFKYNAVAPSTPLKSNTVPEASAIEKAVKDANPTFSDKIGSVTLDGTNVKVTYKDGSTDTLSADSVFTIKPTAPTVTPVKNTSALTTPEKQAVEAAVRIKNPDATTVVVGNDGSTTLTYSNGSTATLTPAQTVKAADANGVKAPAKPVPVKNTDALTEAEKTAVTDAVKAVNPGTEVSVADNGEATVTFPDGSTATLTPAQTVKAADANGVKAPAKPVPVKNTDALTEAEKTAVTDAVKAVNPGTEVSVADNGEATVTFPDGSTATLTPAQTVKAADANGVKAPAKPVPVKNTDALTEAEKTAVTDAVKAVNPGTEVSVADNGEATVTFPDGSTATLTPAQTVKAADANGVKAPAKPVPVKNTDALTEAEKTAVTDAVKAVNPGTEVSVADNGEATVTFPDGSTATLTPAQTVKAADANGVKAPAKPVPVKNTDALTEAEKTAVTDAVKAVNPGTEVSVADNGEATVTFPDGSTATLTPAQTVKAADANGVKAPAKPVPVKNTDALTEAEKTAVTDAVKAVNPGTEVSVADNGEATVTFPDGSTATLTPAQTVKAADANGVKAPAKPVPVKNTDALTEAEKTAVTDAVKAVNPGTEVSVADNGEATVTFPDGSTATLTPAQTVKAADANGVKAPAKPVPVKNTDALTEAEKTAVTDAVKAVNPGTEVSVADNGEATVTFPDGSTATLTPAQTVKAADANGVKAPAKPVPVKNTDALTEAEKTAVTDAVKAVNPGTEVSVADNGEATVTFPDGSTATLTPAQTVKAADANGVKAPAKPVPVKNTDALTEAEKTAVTDAVKAVNPGTEVSVADNGEATVTFPDGSTATLTPAQTVKAADANGVKAPAKPVPVKNTDALTEAEKTAVTDAVKAVNPGTEVSVADNGEATVTFPDGSTATLTPAQTVKAADANGVKAPAKPVPVKNTDALTEAEKTAVTDAVKAVNPGTEVSVADNGEATVTFPDGSTATLTPAQTVKAADANGVKAPAKPVPVKNTDALTEAEKTAVTDAVKAVNPGTEVSVADNGEATVTFPDGSTATLTPAQTVKAADANGVKAPAKPVPVKNTDALTEAEKTAVTDAVKAVNPGTEVSVADNGEATVTFPDGSTATLTPAQTVKAADANGVKAPAKPVPVKNTDALTEAEKTAVTDAVKAVNPGTEVSVADNGEATVTFPDGSTATLTPAQTVKAADANGVKAPAKPVPVKNTDALTEAEKTAVTDAVKAVNPGTEVSVADNGEATVTFPDGSTATLTPAQTVKAADANGVKAPAKPVPVKNTDALTEAEKTAVTDAVKAVNPGTEVSVADNGEATVTFPDGSTATLTPAQTVKAADANGVKAPAKPVPVKNTDALTEAEKTAVTDAVKAVNPGTEVSVADNGEATVTFPDGSTATLTPAQTVKAADANGVKAPAKPVPVKNTDALTEAEKTAVTDAVKAVNPGTEVSVADNGEATVTFPDGSTATLTPAQTVKAADANGVKAPAKPVPVKNTDALTEAEKTAVTDAVKAVNPGTEVSVADNGEATVTFPDGSTATLTPAQTVKAADANGVKAPAKPVPVKNTDALTEAEKTAVTDAVKAVNPGTEVSVADNGEATVTFPDGSTATLTPAQTVKAADANGVKAPAKPVPVKNTDALTEAEKTAVTDAVKAVNPGTEVSVADNGEATVTFPDGSTATLTPAQTVKAADANGVKAPAKPVPVKNTDALTEAEKTAVTDAVKAVNPGTEVSVADNGEATVTFPDGSTATLTPAQTVKAADANGVKAPAKPVPVKNTDALTEAEKTAVTDAVKAVNPGTEVSVADNGEATVTFPDGSTATLTPAQTVKAADANGVKAPAKPVPVKNTDALTEAEKTAVTDAVKAVNPGTEVSVADNGEATVTFPDGSTATLTPAQTVKAADANGVKAPAKPVPVKNTDALTEAEKTAVTDAVKAVNPGTEVSVADNGDTTVTFPDGTTATLPGAKTVKEADSKGVQEPAAKTPVQNTSALTQPEKDAVKKAVETANPSATKVEVGDNGDTTVTFPDGTTATLPGAKTVKEADSKGVQEPAAKTPVQNTSALTQPEKDAVKKAVETANPSATKVEVGDNGDTTVTFPDGTTATLPGAKTVKEADSKGVQEPAAKTPVQNTSALTQPEKDAVKKAVETANPSATKVEVGDNGDTTVTFPDGTTATLPGAKTVKEADSKGVQEPAAKTPVQNTSALTQPEKDAVKKAVETANPSATKVEVGDNGDTTVTFPDGTTATLPGAKTVKEADSKGVQEPAAKTPVQNTSALTQPEKDAVKKAVETANPSATKVEVGDNGDTTVTFPDGTTATLPGAKTVKEADSKGVQEPAAKTPVQNTSALTQPEKDAVKKAVETANPSATKVEVGDNGDTTVTFPDGTTATLPGAKTVKEADSKGVQEPAAKTPVQNTSALTQPEKDAVKKAVETANPSATKVEVGDNGDTTVTFPDGTTATLPGAKTVKEADSKGVQEPAAKTPVQNTSALTQPEKDAVKKAVETANPSATKVEVGDNGDTTVTFPDGTTATLPGAKTVKEADSKGVQEPAAKTPVQNTSALTQPEKDAVKKAVETANPSATKVEVGDNGDTTVTFPDGTTATLPGAKTVKEADSKGVQEPAAKTPVQNTSALTQPEKDAVKKAVETANPSATKVEVGDNGDTTVTFPDGTTATLPGAKTVKEADSKGVQEPAAKTPVQNTSALTQPEKDAVKKAVETANPSATKVEVGDNGDTTVTFPDGTTATLPGAKTVKEADSKGVQEPAAKTPVQNTSALTQPEKDAVKKAVETANPSATKVEVGDNGDTTVTFPDGTTATLPGAKTVKEADSKGVQEPAAKTPVQNTSALTQPEKDAVKKAVETANPSATKVEVGDNGDTTVTFPDGTTATLPGAKTVKEADSKGVQEPAAKTPVQNTSALTQPEKDAVKKAVETANPSATKVEVGDNGDTTVTFPDGTTATLPGAKTVKEADSKGVQEPAAKTPVQNTSALTQPEKDAVKKAVETANPSATKVEVGDNGDTTVTFPDGTTATLPGAKTVKEADSKGVQEPAAKTPVQNTSALTQPEKDAVKKAVETANPSATKVEVGDNGDTTVTFPDGTTATLPGAKTVKEADSKGVQEPAAKTPVQNTSALTQPEKDAVKKAVETANPSATKVEVGDNGDTTVTFPDGTTATLPGAKTVKEADSKGVQEPAAKTPVQNTSALTQPEKDAVKKAVETANPSATKVEVGDNGDTTVTFPDGTTATLPGAKTVKEADSKGVQEPAAKTPVQNTSALTQPEKDAVKKAVETANPSATKVEVGDNGDTTVTFPDGTTATLPGAKTVKEADSKGVQEPAAKTPVQNTSALTQPEKDAVKKAVETANPSATKVEVGDNGDTTVTFPDGTTATLPGAKTVKEADSKGVQEPAAKTPVQNTSALTQPEKDAVKKAVETANPSATKVEVGDNGDTTVTFPDGTTATLPGAKTVKEADSKGVQEPAAKTPVQNTSALTQPEKDAVKKAVETANPSATKVEVGDNGDTTVTFPDGTTATLPGAKTVKEADSKGVQEPAAKTPVQNTSALTQPEKDAVKKAVETANPSATKVEVGDNGDTTVTFPDGTTATLPGAKTVKEADSKGVQEPAAKTPVQNTSALTQPEKDAVKKAVETANPSATKVEVGDNGDTTVTFPDGTTATLPGAKTVKEADSKGVQEPAAKTPVQNTSALTQPEKDAVKKAVETANPSATKVEVGDNGDTTVTFPDGTTATLPGAKTVKEADSKGVQEPAAKTPVQNTSALTQPEKDAVKKAVETANPSATKVEVGDNGDTTVTFPDGTTATLPGAKTVKEADSKGVQEPAAKTPVQNTSALTQPEKDAVKKAVETANPSATKVEVGDNGDTTVTFPDGTTATLPGAKTVKEADSKGVQEPAAKTPVQNTSALTQPEKDAVKKAVETANPSATKVEVGDNGDTTVTFPDGTTATLPGAKTVKEADSKGVQEPAAKTPVQNTSALTQPEKDAVKKAVETANPSATKVEVGDNGDTTVTFPDGTTATLPGAKTVKEADSKGVQEPAAKTPVQNTSALTQPEKDAVKKAVETANPSATKVEVGDNGDTTVTFPDGTTATLPGAKTVKEADSKGVQEPAAKTPVQNTSALTQPEKDAVKKAVETANPSATKVEVGDNGDTTVTFPDGTTATLPGAKTVKEADSKGVQEPAAKTPVQNTSALTQPEKDAVKKAVETANPSATKVEVGDNGDTTVTFPDGTTATLPGAKTVKEADSKGVQEPAAKTPVQNTSALTQPEKDAVKKAVETANPSATKVEVGDNGDTTVTFPDGTTATLPGAKTVKEADSKGVQEPAAKTPVQNTSALTQPEKDAVKKAVETANPSATKVEVGDNGDTTVTFPDGTTATLPGAKTVYTSERGELPDSFDLPKLIVTKWVDEDGNELKSADAKAPAELGESNEAFEHGEIDGYVFVRTLTDESDGNVTHVFRKLQDTKAPDAPVVNPVKAGDTAVTGKAEPGSNVEVTLPDGTKVPGKADQDGNFSISVDGLKEGDKVSVTATDAAGNKSGATDATVAKAAPAAPSVNPVKAGDKVVTGKAEPGSNVEVTLPDGTKVPGKADQDGNFSISVDGLKEGDKVSVTATDEAGNKSDATTATVAKADDKTAPNAPVVNPVKAGDKAITGTAEAGSTVEVTLPDGTKVSAKADKDGKFSIPVNGLNAGDTVSVTATDESGNTSATTTVTVSNVNVGGKEADNAKVPALTPVVDPNNLTDAEKAKVAEEVKKANPTATDVKVNNDGSVVVTFADGSVATIAANKVVKEATKESSAQAPAKKAGAKELPNTGTKQSNASLGLALLAAVTGGLLISKKRKEEE